MIKLIVDILLLSLIIFCVLGLAREWYKIYLQLYGK